MQGNIPDGHTKEAALDLLAEGLSELGKRAKEVGVSLIYEPLNRYESNLINTLQAGGEFLDSNQLEGIVLLADLFHMNIEEPSIENAINAATPMFIRTVDKANLDLPVTAIIFPFQIQRIGYRPSQNH